MKVITIDFELMRSVLFVLSAVLIVYIIVILHNLNESTKVVKRVLQRNEENVDNLIDNVTVISKSVVEPVKAVKQMVNFIKKTMIGK